MNRTSKANSASTDSRVEQSALRSTPAARKRGSTDRPKAIKRSPAKTISSAERDLKPGTSRGTKSLAKNAPNDRATKAVKLATKAATVIEMLQSPEGATLEALMEATGWQAHSVRGFLSGTLKRKQGLTIVSEKRDRVRRYRIPA